MGGARRLLAYNLAKHSVKDFRQGLGESPEDCYRDVVGSEKNNAVKGISKAICIWFEINRMDHRFLAVVLEMPDSNRNSADGLAFCNNLLRQWYMWLEGARGPSRSNNSFGWAVSVPTFLCPCFGVFAL